jgi:hypothetical protein
MVDLQLWRISQKIEDFYRFQGYQRIAASRARIFFSRQKSNFYEALRGIGNILRGVSDVEMHCQSTILFLPQTPTGLLVDLTMSKTHAEVGSPNSRERVPCGSGIYLGYII